MTTFDKLYESVMNNERGWNPNDQGSVAYNGINRAYHGKWKGWAIIDKRLPAKRGHWWPDLEPHVKEFYSIYWANAGLNVNRVSEFKIAAMLADMATQHGLWEQIVHAALHGGNPMDNKLHKKVGDTEYNIINGKPADSYKKIAAARLIYCQKVKLKNEADRLGIINRAKKYVADALKFIQSTGTARGAMTIVIIAAAVFFCQLEINNF